LSAVASIARIPAVAAKKFYRIRFMNEGRIFELFARQVTQGSLFGFIEISQLAWGKKSEVIIDPSEQDLRNEFSGVSVVHVPMHAVIRIDEVERSGTGKIIPIAPGAEKSPPSFPIYTPSGTGPGKSRS
jgi:hypothetical protein